MKFKLSLLIGIAFFPSLFFGQPNIVSGEADSHVNFVQNQGQWENQVLFQADVPGGKVFLEKDRLTWTLCDFSNLHDKYFKRDVERSSAFYTDCHAFRVNFHSKENGFASQPFGLSPKTQYNNYFIGDDPNKWASKVPLFEEVVYPSVYNGIDFEILGKDKGLKYQFKVRPGSDPSQIVLDYDGIDDLFVKDGQLHIVTSVAEIIESAPYAYQLVGGIQVPVACNFVVEGKSLRFELPNGYNSEAELVIDPTLVFSTFTGSTADNFGYTATYDDLGNFYAGGVVFGVGYPLSVGPFQGAFGGGGVGGAWTMNGGVDMSLTKFNPTGSSIIWSTYVGGTGNEQPHSLITNPNGELFVYGCAWSSNFPVTAGCFDNTQNGAGDIVVLHFNAAGTTLIGSTYVGGTAEDGMNITTAFSPSGLKVNYGDDARGEIMLDDLGNVYIASMTQSINFPTQLPYQAANAGLQDAVVFKMNSNLTSMIWGTYLGGTSDDAAYSIKVDANHQPYVAGGTESANFPVTVGSYQDVPLGSIDGYICQFTSTGSALLNSSFISTAQYDQCYFVELDLNGDVYLYGQTLGAFPVSPGVYSNPGSPQFIMKMDPALSTATWSTVFGVNTATINISPTAFLIDVCGFIYISGWGGADNFSGNTVGMALTPDAFQNTTDGSDFYFMVLEKDAQSLVYGSFFGGPLTLEHVDGGTSRFNANLEIYQAICGGCGGNSDMPTTPGVVSQTNNSFNCNEACVKFKFDPQSVIAAYIATPFDSCAPFPVTLINQSSGGAMWIWEYGDGSPPDTTFAPTNVGHVYVNPGAYQVSLTVIDSNSCNIADTVTQTVTVHANPISGATGGAALCAGGGTQLTATGGTNYLWTPAAGLSNPNIAGPIASPSVTTNYMVIVSDQFGCVDTSYATVTVSSYQCEAGPATSFCEGTGGAQLFAGVPLGGTGPYWYEWWCDSTNTWCGLDSVFDDDPIANPNGTTTYYLQVTDFFGCQSLIDSVVVTVLPNPIVDAGPDRWICSDSAPGAFLTPTITNAPGPFTFDWSPGVGLNDSTIQNPYARPDTTTIYTLIVVSSNGCSSDVNTVDSVSTTTVHVWPLPVADAGPDREICYLDSIMLQGIGYDAGPLYGFQWSPASGLTDSTLANPMASPSLTVDYVLTVWSNGCPSIGDTVNIMVHTLPTLDAGPDRDICYSDSVMLDALAGGDSTSSFYNYVWTPGIYLSNDSIEDPNASPNLTTTFFVTAYSEWGCPSAMDSMLLTIKPSPIAEAGVNQSICSGQSIQLNGTYSYPTADTALTSQVWFNWFPNQFINDTTISNPWVTPTQTQYYYFGIQYNTCRTLDSVLITVTPTPVGTLTPDTTNFCEGDSIRMVATGGLGNADFSWTPSGGLSSNNGEIIWASPNDTTTYTLIISEGGCSDTLSVTMNPIDVPGMAFISSLQKGCVPFDVSFLELSDNTILVTWDFGDGVISNDHNPTHTYTLPGIYPVVLIGSNAGACKTAADTMFIEVIDTAHVNFTSNPEYPVQMYLPNTTVQFTDQSFNGYAWDWIFGDGLHSDETNPSHTFLEPGEYFVTLWVENEFGCPSKVTHGPYIVLLPDLFIPNVFTPNGEPPNEEFLVNYSGDQPFLLNIFDRWGNKLFETRDKYQGWDGKLSNKDVPDGVYYYVVTIGDKKYAGNVTLVR